MRIGELLIDKGVISEDSMGKALSHQSELFLRGVKKTILQILVEHQFIDSNKFIKITQELGIDIPIGEILVMEGHISQEDLLRAKEIQNTNNKSIGNLLCHKGFLSQDDLDKSLQIQKNSYKKLGDILVEKGIISKDMLKEVLSLHYKEDKALGDILLSKGYVSKEVLKNAIDYQRKVNKKIGEILVENGLISQENLDITLQTQRKSYRKIGDILINDLKVTNIEILTRALAKQHSLSRIKPDTGYMDILLFFDFTKDELLRLKFIPYGKIDNEINKEITYTILISDPKRHDLKELIIMLVARFEEIERKKHKSLNEGKKPEERIPYPNNKIKIIFGLSIEQEITNFIINSFNSKTELEDSIHRISEIKHETVEGIPILHIGNKYYSGNDNINAFVNIIKLGIDQRASDIHIEPFDKKIKIRYRIDGVLKLMNELPAVAKNTMLNAVKTYFKFADAWKPFATHDERVRVFYENKNQYVDLRISIIPTQFGEKMVIRLLIQNDQVQTFQQLGMSKNIMMKYEKVISMSSGIIIVSGPTGSGKTTTLFSTIGHLNKEGINIITAEDPPEYIIDGVNQVKISEGKNQGITYNQALKSVLRQDPDIIMFGEMRDSESASIAMAAGLTGHLLFTTLHANDTTSSITRLGDLGIKPFMLSSTLVSILAQRLVRKICPQCQEEYKPKDDVLEFFRVMIEDLDELLIDKKIKFKKGIGCDHCNYTGYKGRVGIYELLCVNETLKKSVINHATAKEIEDLAREFGMTSMVEDGFLKAIDYTTTLEEVLRVSRSLQAPKRKRKLEEIRRILEGDLSKDEIIRAIYSGGEDDSINFIHAGKIKEKILTSDEFSLGELEKMVADQNPDNISNANVESMLTDTMNLVGKHKTNTNKEIFSLLSSVLNIVKMTLNNTDTNHGKR
ncbi:MAG: ATPase, T2SS/T4P/T4SS family [Candidatus Gracilibacteria bacterium]|nr:ATPase, T2SS/T4P/T4SS family [Candidatus Gracilibacteria bacterium]